MTRTGSGAILTLVVVALTAGPGVTAEAGWKDDYDAGLKARIAGDFDKAESLMKRSVSQAEAEAAGVGRTHAVVEALVGLSNVYIGQQRMAESSVVLDQALLTLVRSPAPEPADLALVYESLSTLKTIQKNYPESESLLKRALTVREKALGPNHAEVASTLNQLADVSLMQKNYDEAETYIRRALTIREAQPNAPPLDLAKSYNTLAGLRAMQENYLEADLLFRRVVALQEEAHGPDHPDVASALMQQAGVRLAKGLNGTLFSFLSKISPAEKARADKNKAEAGFQETAKLLARVLAIREKTLGPDDTKTLEAVMALAIAETEQGDRVGAEPHLRRLIAAREKNLGPDQIEVDDLVVILADNVLEQRKYRDAIPLLKRLIAARDAEASKGSGKPSDPLESLRIPMLGEEDEQDKPDDLDAKLRRAVRLADLADDPAAHPTEGDLDFLKGVGVVPGDATLPSLDDLRKVKLDGRPIDDGQMAHLQGLVSLKSLIVRPPGMTRARPNVTDAGLAPLRKLTDLRHLSLSGTTTRGAGLEHLTGMTELSHLDLSFTLIDDDGLSHLPTFPKLRSLNLSGTKVTDASIPAIKKQAGLTYLGLLRTKISEAGIKELRRGRDALHIHKPDGSSISGSASTPPGLAPFESGLEPAPLAPFE